MMAAPHVNNPKPLASIVRRLGYIINAPQPRRIVTLTFILPLERVLQVKITGTANRAMSLKIPIAA